MRHHRPANFPAAIQQKLRLIRAAYFDGYRSALALHPEWQREIGFWLKGHFPNIQFLVTTHSPIICQAADINGLFVLPAPGSDEPARALTKEEYRKVIASRPDTILLTPAFGLQNTRSPLAVESRAVPAKFRAKVRSGGKLTPEEVNKEKNLSRFVAGEEEL